MKTEPVRHDHAVEAPFVTQNLLQQFEMLRSVFAVEQVVAAHQSPGFAVNHSGLKRSQINFA